MAKTTLKGAGTGLNIYGKPKATQQVTPTKLPSLNDLTKMVPTGGQPAYQPPQAPSFTNAAAQNPQLQALAGDYQKYRGELAKGSDQDATLAMQRHRDAMSGMAKEFAGEASQRGILGSGAAQKDLLNRVIKPGQAQMAQLNANLTSDARNKQLQTLQGQSGVAGQQAGFQQAQQQLGLDTWRAQQQNALGHAQLAQSAQNQQLNQILALVNTMGNLYTGGF